MALLRRKQATHHIWPNTEGHTQMTTLAGVLPPPYTGVDLTAPSENFIGRGWGTMTFQTSQGPIKMNVPGVWSRGVFTPAY